MYSFNRSSNFIFIRTSPFVLLFFIIRKGSEEFCNPVTKYLYGYFLMYIMAVSYTHLDVYKRQLDDFAEMLADVAVIEKPAKQEGRSMSMVLTEKR